MADTCPFWGHWYPCFGFLVTSPLGFNVRVGSASFTFCGGKCNIHSPRSTSGATLADLLVASVQPVTSPHACAEVGLGSDSNGQSPGQNRKRTVDAVLVEFGRWCCLRRPSADSCSPGCSGWPSPAPRWWWLNQQRRLWTRSLHSHSCVMYRICLIIHMCTNSTSISKKIFDPVEHCFCTYEWLPCQYCDIHWKAWEGINQILGLLFYMYFWQWSKLLSQVSCTLEGGVWI